MGDGFYGGMQVDPRTGLPIEKKQSEREILAGKILETDVAAGLSVEQQLASKGGEFFIGFVNEALERRIDELVQADPAASALLSLFTLLGGKIHAGKDSAQRLAMMRLKREDKNLKEPI